MNTVYLDPMRQRANQCADERIACALSLLTPISGIDQDSPEAHDLRRLLITAIGSDTDQVIVDLRTVVALAVIDDRQGHRRVTRTVEGAQPHSASGASMAGRFEARMCRLLWWLGVMNGAHAAGIKKMLVLDVQEQSWDSNDLGSGSQRSTLTTIDVELRRFAALLDVLQEVGSRFPNQDLLERLREAAESAALQAMADHDDHSK